MSDLLAYLIEKVKNNPAIVTGLVVSAVLWVAAQLNIVLDEASVQLIVAPIVAGVITRQFVVPVAKVQRLTGPKTQEKLVD